MSDKEWTADTWCVQLYNGANIVKEIELTIAGDAKDFCNQARSFYWFRQRQRGSLLAKPRPQVFCAVRLRDDPILEFELHMRDQLPQMIQHTNVWELYKDIGYDHKRKRYMEPEQ